MSALPKLRVKEDRSPLTVQERSRLIHLERQGQQDRQAAERFHTTLAEIFTSRLYREDYPTFEAYLSERWLISKGHGYRLVGFVETARQIEDAGLPAPATERQTRPLSGLPAEVKVSVYREAVEASGGEAPEPAAIREAVARRKPAGDDVERARAAGIIPANATVIVEEIGGDDPGDDEPPAVRVMTEDEWVESLPAWVDLSDSSRVWFKQDALAFRDATDLRVAFARAAKPAVEARKKAGKGHIGQWLGRMYHFLKLNDPSRWVACWPCRGTGRRELIGECPDCRGHGYHL